MDQHTKPSPQAIVRARVDNPKMRERDLATQLGISEAELVAAHCGDGVLRIEPRVNDLLVGLGAVGEVMALTRNESVVHEKIGVYENVEPGEHAALVLGEQIDLRVFRKRGNTASRSKSGTATISAPVKPGPRRPISAVAPSRRWCS